jgi:hypothetical protein
LFSWEDLIQQTQYISGQVAYFRGQNSVPNPTAGSENSKQIINFAALHFCSECCISETVFGAKAGYITATDEEGGAWLGKLGSGKLLRLK